MRIADLSLSDSLTGQLEAQQSQITTLDQELSSGIALQNPASNPVAVTDTLAYQQQISQLQAVQNSASTASSMLGVANGAANSVINTLDSVHTLVLQALSSGSQNSQTYTSISEQIQGQIQSLLGLANTTYAGTPVFAGTAAGTQAYDSSGNYLGNNTAFTIQLGTQRVNATVPGTQLFGGGTTGTQNLFTTLQNIVTDLANGPSATAQTNLSNDLNDLNANVTQAQTAAATLGEASQEVAAVQTATSTTSTQIQNVLADTEDTNVASVSTELQQDLTSYQAALYAVSQTVPETLATYLK